MNFLAAIKYFRKKIFPHFLVAIADLTHPLSNYRSSIRIIGCFKGVANTLADGIFRWDRDSISAKLASFRPDVNWQEQILGEAEIGLIIFFATVIIVVLQRFAEDSLIVLDYLVYLDDAPKGEDGRPKKEGTLEIIRRAVWGMLCADDAGVVSTSSRGLTRIIGVIVVACQEFGLTVSEKKTEAMHLWSHPNTASNAL